MKGDLFKETTPQGGLIDPAECEERSSFEILLADLSAQFTGLPAGRMDEAIVDALRSVCDHTGLDLAALWQWDADDPRLFTLTHQYRRLEGPPIPRQLQAAEALPWGLREVMTGRSFLLASVDDMPEGAGRDRDHPFVRLGVRDALTLPLAAGGGAPFGALSFHGLVSPRVWSDTLVRRLELVAQYLGNTLARLRSEQALHESGARMAAALDVAGLGFYELINGVRVSFLDRRAREILGASEADEQAGQLLEFWLAHIHPDDQGGVMEVRQLMEEAGQDRMTVDYRFLNPERGVIFIHHLVHVIERDATGLAVRTIGVLQDVTERKLKEEDLRAKQAHIASAIEAAGLGFYEMGENGRTHVTDDRLRALIGLPVEEDESRVRDFWLAHIHPEDLPRVQQKSRDLLGGTVDRVADEYRYRHPTRGEFWFYQLARVLERDASGQAVRTVGVIQDVTERKAAEMEARRIQNELAHAARMSILGELAASLAHELNQPLAAILSNAQAARRFLAAPAPDLTEIRAILDDIVRDDKRAGDVIHHMRAMLQKKGGVAPEPLDLNTLVRGAAKLVHGELVARDIGLELDLAARLPAVLAGRVEMQQVLLNLMVNAMDAMREQPAERRRLRIWTLAAEGRVRMALRDHGHGISDHAMAEIFRPFFTTKAQGLGMGLSISRSMVEAHGGALWAENAASGGAIFWIELPVLPEESAT